MDSGTSQEKLVSRGLLSKCLKNPLGISIAAALFIAEDARLRGYIIPLGETANKAF